jgi:RimJ/RimL family protein N-acetyltransferase
VLSAAAQAARLKLAAADGTAVDSSPVGRSWATTVDRFVRHWGEKAFGVFALEDLAPGRFLGQCGLNTIDELGEVEVLYALERAAWGRGLATEAAGAALAFGFDEARLPRIVAVTRPAHVSSRRVMEKLGMRHERGVDVFGIHAVLYALTRDAYRAAGQDRSNAVTGGPA